jgi:hypothetical protein
VEEPGDGRVYQGLELLKKAGNKGTREQGDEGAREREGGDVGAEGLRAESPDRLSTAALPNPGAFAGMNLQRFI